MPQALRLALIALTGDVQFSSWLAAHPPAARDVVELVSLLSLARRLDVPFASRGVPAFQVLLKCSRPHCAQLWYVSFLRPGAIRAQLEAYLGERVAGDALRAWGEQLPAAIDEPMFWQLAMPRWIGSAIAAEFGAPLGQPAMQCAVSVLTQVVERAGADARLN